MAKDADLRQAVQLLRKELSLHGTKGSRTHYDSAEDNVHRLRCLEREPCAQCTNFMVEFHPQDGRMRVRLRCLKELSPLELYRKAPLGEIPTCPRFSRKA